MKPRGDDLSSRSCSCTSCFYKPESEHPSIRRMLAKGSRIDKLFIGKYLPLREEKLLNRLVRTRAVYDDIRTQLLSDSNVSESDKGDLKPTKQMLLKREGKRKDIELSDAERSSVLLQLINLVDKGATLGPQHKLSECCSCCVCGPKGYKFSKIARPQKHKHKHASSRSSFTSGMRTRDERRFATHGHRARYIRSDPCNCTCSNEECDLNVTGSKAIMKKVQKPGAQSKETLIERKVGGRKKMKGYKTRQGINEAFSRSMMKLKKSKSQMSAKLGSRLKKSMEKMKATEHGVKVKIKKHTKRYNHSEILYSLRGGNRRRKSKEELELEVKETIAKIKKDSLSKIREDMKKKKYIEEWACNFECDPEKCEPEECYKIKMQQKMRKDEKNVHYKEKNIGDTIRVLSKTQISQTKIPVATAKTETNKQETKTTGLKENTELNKPQIKSKGIHVERENNKKNSKNEGICECKTTAPTADISNGSKKSLTELPSTTTKTSASETTKQKRIKTKAPNIIGRPKINVRSGGYALKRCFCTLKIKPKGNKPQRARSFDSKSAQTKTSKTLSTGGEDKLEQRKARRIATNTKSLKQNTKSTSSLMSKSSSGSQSVQGHSLQKVDELKPSEQHVIKRKNDDEPTTNKQAVRISSNFSFNIEFYKETPSTEQIVAAETETQSKVIHSHKIYRKVRKHKRLANRQSQITTSEKSNSTVTRHNLRRCFCTLLLPKKIKTATYSKGTLTSGQNFTDKTILRNIGTEKRIKRQKYTKYQLLSYECVPGICVPDECDPFRCLELIKKRNTKQTSRGSATFNRKARSTYSITDRRGSRSKTKKVQSVFATTHKEDKSLVMSQRKVASSPSRQVVRIGSSFSFDIEFYKDKPREIGLDNRIAKELSSTVKLKTRGSQQKHSRTHRKNSSIIVQSTTKEKGIFIESAIKRCFCTLKLQKKAKMHAVHREWSTAATETVPVKNTILPDMVTKSTQMKKKRYRQLGLLPYECEPGICVPGECDPYQCLESIKLRKNNRKGFVTGTNKNLATASTTSSSKSRQTLIQSNLIQKQRKRSKYTASSSYPKVPIPVVTKSPHQAALIESGFSFNIEFAKSRPQELQLSDKPVMEEPVKNVRMNQKGENPNKTNLKHSESQSMAVKKIIKGSRIKPMIKRCFCSLKLQNNKMITKPTETIVMPVQVLNESFALRQNPNHAKYVARQQNDKSFFKLSLPMTTKSNTINWFTRNISTSSTEFPLNSNKTLTRDDEGSRSLGKISNETKSKTKELNISRAQLIGVNPYLKKSFFALNLQVQNHQKKSHKLLPYECEPGVCIPGECNPYECLKLINKRLMKRSSTMTTSDNRSQSTSSGNTRVRSSQQQSGRTHQERADKGKDRVSKAPKAIKYESPPTQTHKQAVRVGSTFSFDIEFFKNKSSPINNPVNKDVVQEKRKKGHDAGSDSKTVRRNHKGTRGSQILRQDRSSQSSIMTHDKGQNITRPKRCFCTLKLQKRGKQHVQVGHEAKPQLQYTNTGQNTKSHPYKVLDLDPNECEPGVCIPGKCDPYECLERIKRRRKDFASDMRPSMISSSIMTNQPKKHSRGKHVQIKEKRRKTKGFKSTPSSVSRPSVEKSGHPSRQAVRIGSSFNFNVEFFKEKSHEQGTPKTTSDTAPVKMKTKTKDHNQNTKTRQSPSSKERSSQDSTKLNHQNMQHGPNTRAIGTKTGAFLKRCFCTAKFFQNSPPNGVQVKGVPSDVKATPSLMQRCLYTLKLLTAKSKPTHATNSKTAVSIQTPKMKENKIKPLKLPKLEPHECEPGVCVPGLCNPYECLERIKRRNRDNKISSTENAGTRSTSTGFRSSKTTGSHIHTKEKRQRAHKIKKSQPISTAVVKPMTESPSLNRNVVRIGSNFSFNIEFYKDKISPTFQNVQRAAKEIKKKRRTESTASTKARQRGKDRGVNKYGQSYSRKSQADFIKKEDRATGMLKRCFCTLALHKQAGRDKELLQNALVVKEQGTESPHYKTYPIVDDKDTITKKPYKLEPYECEPGVCTPGECDPYECLKRIQKRREQGTSTPRNRRNSISTLMTQSPKLKDHQAQSYAKHKKVARPSQQRTQPSRESRIMHYGDQGQHRQAVRIGSNFSFNVEFSKSRTGGDQAIKIRKEPKADGYKTRNSSSKPERRRSIKSARSQGKRRVRDSDTQFLVNKVRSTLTETTPFLKRCFCTLKFKNIDKKPHDTHKKSKAIKPTSVPKHTEHRDNNMSISTSKEKPFKTLLPYECEPGVCVPGQCDPNECLKRIEKRNMQTKGAHTDRPRGRGVSTITAETRTSPKGLQNQIEIKPKRISGQTHNEKITPVRKQHVTEKTAENKQAVRVGSSFSFDVEFSKDKTNKTPFHTNTTNVYPTLVSTKNINSGFKKHSTAMSSSVRKQMNRHSQSIARKTISTGSRVGPLLKRCFCTLKLQKVGRLQRPSRLTINSKIIKKPISTHKSRKSSIPKYKDTGVETKITIADLLPYECEPNICVPGSCNLYECLERIRKRKLSDSTKNVRNRNTKKVSGISGRKSRIRKTLQTLTNRADEEKFNDIRLKDRRNKVSLTATDESDQQAVHKDTGVETKKRFDDLLPYECEPNFCVPGQCNLFECLERIKKRKMVDPTINCMSRTRKVSGISGRKSQIRKTLQTLSNIGSNFSFKKEQTPKNFKNVTFDTLPKSDKCYNARGEKLTIKRDTFDQGQRTRHTELQASLEQEHKATGIRPLLQRCFCTLKLSEGNKQEKPPEPDVQIDHQVKPALKYTNTGQNTEKRYHRLSDLDPNECEPGVCIPGNCDPYECLQRIRKRNVRHMATGLSRNRRYSQTSLTSFGPISKSKRIQYSPKQKSQGVKISNIVEQPRFPFLEAQYYQGLKIGSNISVNIEFFKEYALPTNRQETEKKSRGSKNVSQVCGNQTCNKPDIYKEASSKTNTLTKSKKQQADGIKTEHKSSFVGNTLKRCFCTAKLAGCKSIITVGRVDKLITNSPFQPRKLQIYQMHQDNAKSRHKQNGDLERTQNAATRINNKYFSEDPLSTDRTNLKRNRNSDDMKTILPYAPKKFHKNASKTLLMRKKVSNKKYCCTHCKGCNKEDVLPTKSAKRLTKKQEKILITNQNGLKRFVCNCVNIFLKNVNKSQQYIESTCKIINDNNTNSKIKSHPKTSHSKRKSETKKQEKMTLANQNGLKRFVCNCICSILKNKNGSQPIKKKSCCKGDDSYTKSEAKAHLKTSKSERKPKKKHENKVKQSKSLNVKNTKANTTNLFVCPLCQANFNNGDFKKTVKLSRKSVKKSDSDSKSIISEVKKAGGDVKSLKSAKSSEKKNRITSEEETKEKHKQNKSKSQLEERRKTQCGSDPPCCVCKNGKKLETINLDENKYGLKLTKAPKILPKQEKELFQGREVKSQDKIGKSKGKEAKSQNKKEKSQGKAVKSQDEKGKSQGKEVKSQDKKDKSQGKAVKSQDDKGKSQDKEVKSQDKKDKSQGRAVNSQNKKDKPQSEALKSQDQKGKTQSKAVKSQEKKGKPQSEAIKSQDKKGKTQGIKKTDKQTQNKSEKPCICGSSVCAKISKKEKLAKIAVVPQKPKKPCVCGSQVCAKEVKYMQDEQNNKKSNKKKKIDEDSCNCSHVCGCQSYFAKKAAKEQKKKKKQQRDKIRQDKINKQLEKRRKEYAKEDRERAIKRIKKDFKMYRQVQKTKDAGDCALFTESILDLAKLGCTTGSDVLRSTFRTITDPKNTCRNIRTCIRDPKRGVSNIKKACSDSGVASTCKRVALRFRMMKRFQIIKKKLEQYACTNYLIHMCDKNPKARMKRKKKKQVKGRRVPEPMDFDCSPYMASLRKRPFLAVYYLCPWFYPHCLGMLTIWRQFTDILLFLLAVIVWSPCIMLMETCRAMMCCFMCTG